MHTEDNRSKPKVRQARNYDSVWNSAVWHLSNREMTEAELLVKLHAKTDNEEWIAKALDKLREYGYLKTDAEYARQFASQSFFGEYGTSYIIEKLKKKGIKEPLIIDAINVVIVEQNIDEQEILNARVNSYYQQFTISREKLTRHLQKRGFTYEQVKNAIDQHPESHQLKSEIELKGAKANPEREVINYARKGKGLSVIKLELRKRKVDTSNLDSIIKRLISSGELDFYNSCLQQLKKKYDRIDNSKDRSNAYGMLMRKGFSSDEIKYALEAINEPE